MSRPRPPTVTASIRRRLRASAPARWRPRLRRSRAKSNSCPAQNRTMFRAEHYERMTCLARASFTHTHHHDGRFHPSFPNSCLGTLVLETPFPSRDGVSKAWVPKQEFGNQVGKTHSRPGPRLHDAIEQELERAVRLGAKQDLRPEQDELAAA